MLFFRYLLLGGSVLLTLPPLLIKKPAVQTNNAPVVQTNNAPVVHITNPSAGDSYGPGALITYAVTVSDKEDGESKYEEIPATEIFLELRYFSDPAKAAAFRKSVTKEPAGYTLVKKSDCFNCHAAHFKLIGPSFSDISARYKKAPDLATLASHVMKGSTGIWGKVAMPTHADLSQIQARQMVQWILTYAGDPNADFFRGPDGAFRLFTPPKASSKGLYLLKATYTDHGVNQVAGTTLMGQDITTLFLKK